MFQSAYFNLFKVDSQITESVKTQASQLGLKQMHESFLFQAPSKLQGSLGGVIDFSICWSIRKLVRSFKKSKFRNSNAKVPNE